MRGRLQTPAPLGVKTGPRDAKVAALSSVFSTDTTDKFVTPVLEVYAQLDERPYPKVITIPDQQIAAVAIEGDAFHSEWNYLIKPRT